MPTGMPVIFKPLLLLAQMPGEDEAPPPTPQGPRPMTINDLRQGLRDVHDGKVDNSSFRNGILALLFALAIVVLIIHLRQRKKEPTLPDSMPRLGRELGRKVSFPLGTKMLLKWVARSTQTPYPALLLSSHLFDKCLAEWASGPTLAAARSWGRGRLQRLRPVLFGEVT